MPVSTCDPKRAYDLTQRLDIVANAPGILVDLLPDAYELLRFSRAAF